MRHSDETAVVMTLAEIGDELGVSYQYAQATLRTAMRKARQQLLERLGQPAVLGIARDDTPLRHDDPHRLR